MKKRVVALALATLLCSTGTFATQLAIVPKTAAKNAESKQDSAPEMHIISNRHINRIVTPFENPSIKLDAVDGVKNQAVGNVLYLSTTNNDPIAGFITEQGDESTAISVVLKPMPVAPKDITLNGAKNGGYALAKRFEQASPRTEMIKQVMAGVATGDMPMGYKVEYANLDYLPNCRQSGAIFDFANGQFVSGGDYVVAIGVAKNTSGKLINLQENNCYEEGVVAVSFYPSPKLNANAKSEVLVMYHRNKPSFKPNSKRESLIGRG